MRSTKIKNDLGQQTWDSKLGTADLGQEILDSRLGTADLG